MFTSFRSILTVILLCLPLLVGADQKAKTEDGRVVILRDDGTWVYESKPTAEKKPAPVGQFTKDKIAVPQYKSKRGTFVLHLVPDVWVQSTKPRNATAEAEFTHKEGDLFAMVIAERIAIPIDSLKKIAVDNIRKVDPNASVVKEEKRTVNGKEVTCLVIEVKSMGIELTFYAYYYSGTEGSIQLITWTGRNLFKESKDEMERFLNGIVIGT